MPQRRRSIDSHGGATEEVWSDSAQVRFTGDTIFLAKFPDGWKVRGAGSEPRTELPYDCEVEG